eukprot:TRINITY_DN2777_c1_g1_i1.p1 TRINITY_DN2777_c1_g1~~TRINITY_DN2777_c1_g1_i1.p1  ORF type:complete len:456 (-),score=55.86 TRINITY_DN2777_c1_g1_i1:361-1728(-)
MLLEVLSERPSSSRAPPPSLRRLSFLCIICVVFCMLASSLTATLIFLTTVYFGPMHPYAAIPVNLDRPPSIISSSLIPLSPLPCSQLNPDCHSDDNGAEYAGQSSRNKTGGGEEAADPDDMFLTFEEGRRRSDWEIASLVMTKAIIRPRKALLQVKKKAKVAFLFLTKGAMPFEKVWMRFFEGQKGWYSIYVHSSNPKFQYLREEMESDLFVNRYIPSHPVQWGHMSMVAAERRLLAWALLEPANQVFVLASESCIPLQGFRYVYSYLMDGQQSFVDCFDDPGPHGQGRYLSSMGPEVPLDKFRKGSQWFSLKRRHAVAVVADTLFYNKFQQYCNPGDMNKNCYPDEHYLQTFIHMMDPEGISNYTVTYADWTSGEWHPVTYYSHNAPESIKRIKAEMAMTHTLPQADMLHAPSKIEKIDCMWNDQHRPCFLFARKFDTGALDVILGMSTEELGY